MSFRSRLHLFGKALGVLGVLVAAGFVAFFLIIGVAIVLGVAALVCKTFDWLEHR